MFQEQQTLSVPVIHNDLRHEETAVQIAMALDYLNEAMKTVFRHVNSRIEHNRSKLNKLDERSRIVHVKVEKLAGTNRATKVFSCTKYPASNVLRHYEYSFEIPKMNSLKSNVKINSPLIMHPLQDKSKCFYIKRDSSAMEIRKNVELTPSEGLGLLPEDVEYISLMLLFNTSENLYKDYVMSDPLHVANKSRTPLVDNEDKGEIEAAPMTMSTNDQTKYKGPQYFYSQILQQVPEINVPLDLPDLPGIAGDLRYELGGDFVIAPTLNSAVDLPDVASIPVNDKPLATVATTPDVMPLPSSPLLPKKIVAVPISTPAPPPPPPPPLPPPLTFMEETSEIEEAAVDHITVMIPPLSRAPVNQVSSKSSSLDARSDLMAAIRNAGGSGKAKLRSAQEHKQEAKRIREAEQTPSPSGNLMADLHAKLAMRRKGISGNRADGSSQQGETPIQRMLLNEVTLPVKGSETEDEADWDE